MAQKRLEKESKYSEFDLDNNGIVTDEEISRHTEMVDQTIREEKADSQRKMA